MEYINQLKMLQLGSDSHVDLEKVFNKKQTFDRLAALFPTAKGKLLSYEERKADANHSTTLVYGEIKFEPFAIAIEDEYIAKNFRLLFEFVWTTLGSKAR